MPSIDTKRLWRKLFNEFEIGDRVQIIDKLWLYQGCVGPIVNVQKIGEFRYYEVRLPSRILDKLGIPKSFSQNVGWFSPKSLIYVGTKKRSHLRKKTKGTVLQIIISKNRKIGMLKQ